MTKENNIKENTQEIIKVKAFEMIELPIMDSDKTFMGKVAITNNGDYLRISDVYETLGVDSILGKLTVYSVININHKTKLSEEPEDETGFYIHLDSFNDDELYSAFNKEVYVEWLKNKILPRITPTSEVENNEETSQEHVRNDYNRHFDFEDLLKSIDNRLSKIERTLSELLEEDEDTEDDTDGGSGIDDIDFADFLNNTFGKGNNLLILKRVKK